MLGAITTAGVGDATDHCAGPKAAIGATVEKGVQLMSDDGAVTLNPGLEPHDRGVPRRAGDELLVVFHHHFHWAAGSQREQVANRFIERCALAAKVSADGHRIHANFFLWNTESFGHAFAQ